jgi:membrane protease YdiL (CAAX protease family)
MMAMLGIHIEPKDYARKVAVLALVVFALEEAVSALIFVSMNCFPILRGSLLLPSATVMTHWVLPFLIVFLVEGRGPGALGFTVERGRIGRYAVYALIGLVLPALVVGVDRVLILEFIEQIVQIGMAEEVFFRGYILHRLVAWLGDRKGLVLSAFTFGFAHIVSRVSQHGLEYLLHDVMLGFQMFLGGLIIGYIYIRARNLIPGSILHVAANLYLDKFIKLLRVL